MKKHSLIKRLILVAGLLLIFFLGVSAWALSKVFDNWTREATREQALGHVYSILAAADENQEGLPIFSNDLPDARLLTPDSGVYATVRKNGQPIWQSPSSVGQAFLNVYQVDAGDIKTNITNGLYYLNYGIEWEALDGRVHPYQINTILDLEPYQRQADAFRQQLGVWLGGSGLVLLLLQVLLLKWALRPLKKVTGQLDDIRMGERAQLEGDYPTELEPFKQSLNRLIEYDRQVAERYRNKLGDLAHSLKTPLAVLQNASASTDSKEIAETVHEQLPRIREIMDYQLGKATMMGKGSVLEAVAVEPVISKVLSALQKVYATKNMRVDKSLDDHCKAMMDYGDLMELVGNLLDNSFKYGVSIVSVKAAIERQQLVIVVEDDGPGIDDAVFGALMARGKRKDENAMPGQGIGLSMVQEIIRLYGGTIKPAISSLGGVKLTVKLPVVTG